MQAVILAGGLGTRLVEETYLKPKPMVEIGSKPIIWHIMKIYSFYGINEFIICSGYKGYLIKEYFSNYFLFSNDITIKLDENKVIFHKRNVEDWEVTIIDTGLNTMTAGRLKRVKDYIKDETFCFTYGDGLADINIKKLINNHRSSGKPATVTAVKPPGRFGSLVISENNTVNRFQEKVEGEKSWINGGFFVLEKHLLNMISDDSVSWEDEPLINLSNNNQLNAYKHDGFWRPMDSMRDKNVLNSLWDGGEAPWKIWD